MENHLSFKPEPLNPPTSTAPHVLVIGGGVTGLVTTWVLLDRGYRVTVMSKEWASYGSKQRLTSQIAGALWEFPPAVCGQHTDPISLHHSKVWCMIAYKIWDTIAADPDLSFASGVRMKKSAFFFPYRMEENDEQYAKMLEIGKSGVRGFHHSSSLIKHYGIDSSYGCVDAYELLAPIIDTDQAISWLMGLTEKKGAEFVTKAVTDDIFQLEDELLQQFHADVIVNATGLAGLQLAGDTSCYPIRGALLRVINDGSDFAKLDAALSISADAKHMHTTQESANEIVFLVPRNDKILLVGGISEPHQSELDHKLDSPIIRKMRARAEAFIPRLKHARLDNEYPLAQGLRPFRRNNVRVERELRRHKGQSGAEGHATPTALKFSRIVHSYGQGGAGWSLSFGCAGNVLELVEQVLAGATPRSMSLKRERKL
ncbi:FAD dependent oxidoreductase [Apodospora peruviana]|uniref:FAD dependent oxidoreductase n=1 Tax=Apodospora peruviana TaxID=516989 RepID=A0AAE0I3S8_9PEZI|nr:FAD dependent oxidoreductase [Apodospora peruviana]